MKLCLCLRWIYCLGFVHLGASLTVQSTAYSDWNRLVNGYGSHQCYPIPPNMTLCQNVGYSQMILPNFLQHEDVKEVIHQSNVWISLVNTDCHPDLKRFLCSLYAPVCVKGHQERKIQPCYGLCEEVKKDCLPRMMQFGFDWPEIVKCSKFPKIQNDMCIPPTKQSKPRCSGCAKEPTYEGLISSYCLASIVIRAKIKTVMQTKAEGYLLQLEERSQAIKKDASKPITFSSLPILVSCNCPLLTNGGGSGDAKGPIKTRNGRWLIMGHRRGARLEVSHVSKWQKDSPQFLRAVRAMRRNSEELCRVKPAADAPTVTPPVVQSAAPVHIVGLEQQSDGSFAGVNGEMTTTVKMRRGRGGRKNGQRKRPRDERDPQRKKRREKRKKDKKKNKVENPDGYSFNVALV